MTMPNKTLKQCLPLWGLDSFEPHISTETMFVHVNQLHKGYVNKLNAKFDSRILEIPPSVILSDLNSYFDNYEDREFYRNQMGGNVTHTLFWQIITPNPKPFPGNTKDLKKQIVDLGLKQFGSGWVWGCVNPKRNYELKLYSTRNHDTPYMRGYIPIFCIDVWEHAYFLDKHGDRKAWLETICEYIDFHKIEQIMKSITHSNTDILDLWVLGKRR